MKKLLVVMLLAVAMVVPAFASKDSKFDVVGKLGILVSPSYESPVSPGSDYDSYKGDAANTFAIAVEGYYKLDEKLSVGLGLSYGFESELSSQFDAYHFSGDDKAKLGFTNIYISVKPSLSENIYAIGQIGYGISHGSFYDSCNDSQYGTEFKVDGGGLYFGLGAGVEYKSFIFEILYSINTATLKEKYIWSGGTDYTFKYSSFNVNIGYKFTI
jgi:hypothetical protein